MTLPGKKYLFGADPDGYVSVAHRDDLQLADLTAWSDKQLVEFVKGDDMIKSVSASGAQPGDSVIWDSVTSYVQAALIHAVNSGVGANERGNKDFTPTIEAPGLAAYGARTQYTVMLIRKLLKVTAMMNLNCWFTTHEDTPTLGKTGDFLYQSMFMSENAINLTGLAVSEIWYMSDDGADRKLAFRPVRGHRPMGSRIFNTDGPKAELSLKYDPKKPNTQAHSISKWLDDWKANGRNKLEIARYADPK